MNPDESPDPPGDAPRATGLDGLISCPHCSGWIRSSTEHAGQIVACPHCAGHFQLHESIEPGVAPPPVQRGESPPEEPWFYGFIDTYAKVWMWVSLLVGTLVFLGAAVVAGLSITTAADQEAAWIGKIFLIVIIVALACWLLGIILSVAFMHLAVDIARNLRAIRQRASGQGD